MAAGNTVFDRPELAMTAPGSMPVDDMGEYVSQNLPEPTPTDKPRSVITDAGGSKGGPAPAQSAATRPGQDGQGGWWMPRDRNDANRQ